MGPLNQETAAQIPEPPGAAAARCRQRRTEYFRSSPTLGSLMSVDRLFEAHLPVADLEVSVAFYRDLVRLELAHVIAAPRTLLSAGIAALDFNGKPTHEPMVLAWMPAAAVYFRDPDGHLLEYVAMLPGKPCDDCGVLPWHMWELLAQENA